MAYNVFVSHAWSYSDRYRGTVNLLDTAKENLTWFDYKNYSVPKHDPIVDPSEAVKIAKLTALLKEQIRLASVVIVPAGKDLMDIADEIINWNSNSLANSIYNLC